MCMSKMEVTMEQKTSVVMIMKKEILGVGYFHIKTKKACDLAL